MRIILAEDDDRIARDVSRALDAAGYVVERVRDGEEAWLHGDTEDYVAARSRPAAHGRSGLRRCLHEVCPAGAGDLGKISQEDVTRYIERHARDRSAASGKAMCWSLGRLRALHQAMEAREPADLLSAPSARGRPTLMLSFEGNASLFCCNVGAQAAVHAPEGMGAYAASKAARTVASRFRRRIPARTQGSSGRSLFC